ncbi:hypothetical protein [Ruegeria profundi]|uniref:Uncharacterized protein n=1 Tax=Ruegeria profundi TaxID=1685378 RepID=A0A0X3U229_9RHOB|nr:hypothetical protein AVO44_05455 [Ruegeria profundi]
MLYREAVEINESVLRLSTLLRDLTDDVQGNMKIAVASHVVCPVLDDALARFHANHPAATFSLEVHSSADAIAEVAVKQTASWMYCNRSLS